MLKIALGITLGAWLVGYIDHLPAAWWWLIGAWVALYLPVQHLEIKRNKLRFDLLLHAIRGRRAQ